MKKYLVLATAAALFLGFSLQSCRPGKSGPAVDADAAQKVYVAPGSYDEFYDFVSGGFSGRVGC